MHLSILMGLFIDFLLIDKLVFKTETWALKRIKINISLLLWLEVFVFMKSVLENFKF